MAALVAFWGKVFPESHFKGTFLLFFFCSQYNICVVLMRLMRFVVSRYSDRIEVKVPWRF